MQKSCVEQVKDVEQQSHPSVQAVSEKNARIAAIRAQSRVPEQMQNVEDPCLSLDVALAEANQISVEDSASVARIEWQTVGEQRQSLTQAAPERTAELAATLEQSCAPDHAPNLTSSNFVPHDLLTATEGRTIVYTTAGGVGKTTCAPKFSRVDYVGDNLTHDGNYTLAEIDKILYTPSGEVWDQFTPRKIRNGTPMSLSHKAVLLLLVQHDPLRFNLKV